MNPSKYRVKVYAADRKTVLGDVAANATSIGASKVAKSESAQFAFVDGKPAWVACKAR